jgi:hypothetical protein
VGAFAVLTDMRGCSIKQMGTAGESGAASTEKRGCWIRQTGTAGESVGRSGLKEKTSGLCWRKDKRRVCVGAKISVGFVLAQR